MCSLNCCGTCCGSFSLFGLIFLVIIGAVIDSGSHSIHIKETDKFKRSDAVHNAYIGAAIYAGFVVLSIIMIIAGRIRARNAAANATSAPLLENKFD